MEQPLSSNLTPENSGHGFYSGLGSGQSLKSGLNVTQTLPNSKKTKGWKKAVMDNLEQIGQRQRVKNRHFSDFYEMQKGRFTYAGTGFGEFQEMPWFDEQVRTLRDNAGVPTYIKHFDFIGIVVNCLVGIYIDFEDVLRIESNDEYSTNEFIREKTELVQQFATQTFQNELTKLLLMRGIDPAKNDFDTEEEYQAYQQQVAQQKQALTPEEIPAFMAKNFKVLAVDWAQNTLNEDRVRFRLADLDREEFIDRLLTGRWFRHYRIGYDFYKAERWRPEEVFFSEDVDARYPQEGEFVGRTHAYSASDCINMFGHLMTATEQEKVSKYWNQNDDWSDNATGGGSVENIVKKGFGEDHIVPFKDYYTHDLLKQYESALGVPLGERTLKNKDGEEYTVNDYLPEYNTRENTLTTAYAQYQRSDIEVRTDLLQVTEAYWRSYKRIGLLTYQDERGQISHVLTTDDLLSGFLKENEIRRVKNITLEEFLIAKQSGNLSDYVDTIIYQYVPEIWKGIKIRSNNSQLNDDLYLDVKPLDFQIKSNSDFYNFLLPVAGLITDSIAQKLAPYQVLHNICMNQITDILEREIGIFFLMDINYLPSEYKDKGTHEEALLELMNTAVNTGILPVDMSKQNTAGNQPINSFQRQDLTYGTQVQYRWELAQQYKQEALQQIGITPQLLGQPYTYTTAEGVKQGAQASYAQIAPIYEEMNVSKSKAVELHLAIAQFVKSSGRDSETIYSNSDGDTYFLDILAEDPTFPLRRLVAVAETSSRERKTIEQFKQFMLQDNTVTRNMNDVYSVLTGSTLSQLREIAAENKKRIEEETAAARQHESEMQDKQIEANKTALDLEFARTQEIEGERNQTRLEEKRIDATARVNQKAFSESGTDAVIKATQDGIQNSFRQADLNIKQQNLDNTENRENAKLGLKAKEIQQRDRELDIKERGQELTHENSIINKN